MTYYNSYETPELTFIGSPEVFSEKLKVSDLRNPYLLLKFRPKCDCGKDFRSSGKDKAEQQIKKHLSYKKYANCKPVVEELDYSNVLPTEHTFGDIAGTDANMKRNRILESKIDKAQFHEDLKTDEELRKNMSVILMDDGRLWRMKYGDEFIPASFPTVLDGLQIKTGINVSAKVVSKSKTRFVQSRKTGKDLSVCEVTLQDKNEDQLTLTLWNEQITTMNVGDKVTFTNATTKEGQYWAGRGFGYATRIELGTYKNATQIKVEKPSPEVSQKLQRENAEEQEVLERVKYL